MSDVSNDYIKKLNDLEIYYKDRNIGISKENPVYKLDVDGPIYSDGIYIKNSSITKGLNDELIITNKSSDNAFSLDKNESYLLTDKLGINKQNPEYALDVKGDIKFTGNLVGENDKRLINQNADIVVNGDSDFNKVIVNGPTMFKSNDINGGVIIGESNIDSASGSLIIENDIRDIYNNKFLELRDPNQFILNGDGKRANIYGQVNFYDPNNGVRVGEIDEDPKKGEIYVEKNIVSGEKIKIKDVKDKMLDMSGENNSNIMLGNDTYLGNLNSFGDRKQASLFGNNLLAGENNIKVGNTAEDGYRGIVMDKYSGISFYVNNNNVESGDIPSNPTLSISNSGQMIYSLPILNIKNLNLDDVGSDIHKYIRENLGGRKVGSLMDFSTEDLIKENYIFNTIKISSSSARTFKINRGTNGIEKIFDTAI